MMNAILRNERIMQNPGHPAAVEQINKKNVLFTTSRIEHFLASLSGRYDEVNYLPNRKEDSNERFGG